MRGVSSLVPMMQAEWLVIRLDSCCVPHLHLLSGSRLHLLSGSHLRLHLLSGVRRHLLSGLDLLVDVFFQRQVFAFSALRQKHVLSLEKSKCGVCVLEKRQNDVMHTKHERMCGENVAQPCKTL